MNGDRYEAPRIPMRRTVQENLKIDMFAFKHGLKIWQVEKALNMKRSDGVKYLKQVKKNNTK